MAVRLVCLATVVAVLLGACSSADGPPGFTTPAQLVAPARATPTPLATERIASAKPKATASTTSATPKSGAYYKPSGWDGVSDVNCKDFDTHAHAMSFFKGTGGSTSNDPYGMDGDHDANACETLP